MRILIVFEFKSFIKIFLKTQSPTKLFALLENQNFPCIFAFEILQNTTAFQLFLKKNKLKIKKKRKFRIKKPFP